MTQLRIIGAVPESDFPYVFDLRDGHLVVRRATKLEPAASQNMTVFCESQIVASLIAGELTLAEGASVEVSQDGGARKAMPPFSDVTRAPDVESVSVPGADLTWTHRMHNAPVVGLCFWERFVDGRRVEAGLGDVEAAEVQVASSYRDAMRIWAGELTILEGLERCDFEIHGDLEHLMLLKGLLATSVNRRSRAAAALGGVEIGHLVESGRALGDQAIERLILEASDR